MILDYLHVILSASIGIIAGIYITKAFLNNKKKK